MASLATTDRNTHFVHANSFLPIKTRFLSPEPTLLLLAPDPQDDISSFPVRTFIGLALEDSFVAFWHTGGDLKSVRSSMIKDLAAPTMRALFLDNFASPVALLAGDLRLGEHTREDL